MTDPLARNYFGGDAGLVADPYGWFDAVRRAGRVWRDPYRGVYVITGYEDYVAAAGDTEHFSNLVASLGPFTDLPAELTAGDDIRGEIEAHRDELPLTRMLITMDPPRHTAHRALLRRLLTPVRLKENEEYMHRCATELVERFAGDGHVEFLSQFAGPYTLLVIADLLGVPGDDKAVFLDHFQGQRQIGRAGQFEQEVKATADSVIDRLTEYFRSLIESRRAEPRDDIVTALATTPFPDGSLPTVDDIANLAFILIAAGQETTAKLLGSAVYHLVRHPELLAELRRDPSLLANFVEEALRVVSPVKGSFRLVAKTTELAGTRLPAGSIVMLSTAAANRDPDRFAEPAALDAHRHDARHHVAFGHGAHYCVGAPLARSEARIGLEVLLDRIDDFRLAEDASIEYVDSLNLRGLKSLPLTFTPRG